MIARFRVQFPLIVCAFCLAATAASRSASGAEYRPVPPVVAEGELIVQRAGSSPTHARSQLVRDCDGRQRVDQPGGAVAIDDGSARQTVTAARGVPPPPDATTSPDTSTLTLAPLSLASKHFLGIAKFDSMLCKGVRSVFVDPNAGGQAPRLEKEIWTCEELGELPVLMTIWDSRNQQKVSVRWQIRSRRDPPSSCFFESGVCSWTFSAPPAGPDRSHLDGKP